ncbi:hypothetical protein BD410DRAFT_783971 [Rickenella mellea]|uniref:PH domain-containing protein n=1 Tax=Rickenella mellea TaxID=50990 RepID=A0A4Y7QEY9_9AGAM|nr:hypothetical protein BD410DRAFT_783971 [Rickenella mellea]
MANYSAVSPSIYPETPNPFDLQTKQPGRISPPFNHSGPTFSTDDIITGDVPLPVNPVLTRRSTRELIKRFESISDAPSPTRQRVQRDVTRTQNFSEPKTKELQLELPVPLSSLKDRTSNPLRESFRNLLSVFGKRGKPKEDPRLLSTRYQSASDTPESALTSPQSMEPPPRTAEDLPLHSGPVLYLCHSLSADTLPVWNPCTAKLFCTHLALEWHTSYGNPVAHTIPFVRSAEVRSLAASNVDATEKKLLPESGEHHVFEIIIDDRPSEKFAVDSVARRTQWVSATWDALLQLHGSPACPPLDDVTEVQPKENIDIPKQTSESAPASPKRESNHSLSSRTPSPSIRNLDNLSVVKKRLSLMEPHSRRTNSFSESRRYQLSDIQLSSQPASPNEHQGERLTKPDGLLRQADAPADNDTVYDLYLRTPGARSSHPDDDDVVSCNTLTTPRISSHLHQRLETPFLDKTPVTPTPVNDSDTDVNPLVSLIQNHVVEQSAQTAAIGHRIKTLQDDVLAMSDELRGIIDEQQPGVLKSTLEELCTKMEQASVHGGFTDISRKLDVITGEMHDDRNRIGNDLAKVLDKIESLHINQHSDTTYDVSLNNTPVLPADLAEVHAKLEELLHICTDIRTGNLRPARPTSDACASPDVMVLRHLPKHDHHSDSARMSLQENQEANSDPHLYSAKALPDAPRDENILQEILSVIKNDQAQRTVVSAQQADNVRYLNELNRWLETYVNDGSAQMQSIAVGVQRLCHELAPVEDQYDQSGHVLSDVGRPSTQKERDARTEALHNSVQELLEVVKAESENRAQGNERFATEAVLGMIDRQRQEQEMMLRNIAAELSTDIRGERLRFVEAMKEATAINVQNHVDEFKKELGKEVMVMTQEVARLQKERHALEQRIAELFSFIARQQENTDQRAPIQRPPEYPETHLHVPQRSLSARGRPLPIPMSYYQPAEQQNSQRHY